jgi:hypothetical protein
VTSGPSRYIDEIAAAGRGVVALIVGDRNAPGFFDFSTRGLVGSFIAFVAIIGMSVFVPFIVAGGQTHGAVAQSVLSLGIGVALQIGFSAILLNQLKRLDGLVPYLVADNWANAFLVAALTLVSLVGLDGLPMALVFAVVGLIVEVNVARLVVTLTPVQIVMLLVAQMLAGLVWLLLVGMLLPTPTEAAANLMQFQ